MAKVKQRADDDGVLFLITFRRKNALAAFHTIFESHLKFPIPQAKLVLLLDYLGSMLNCLELMMKLLSENWGNHEAKEMYKTIFGEAHPKPEFMSNLEEAVKSQKYLLKPSANVANKNLDISVYIPDIEALYDTLAAKVRQKHPKYQIMIDYPLPAVVAEYLRDNTLRFYKPPHRQVDSLSEIDFEDEVRQFNLKCEAIKANMDMLIKKHGTLYFHQGEIFAF